jgi:hypothetical protein
MSCTAGKSAPSRLVINKVGGPSLVKERQHRRCPPGAVLRKAAAPRRAGDCMSLVVVPGAALDLVRLGIGSKM